MKKLLILTLCFSVLSASAQKGLKALRGYVKAENTTEALKEAVRLENDSLWKHEPLVYDYAFKAQSLDYERINEKFYLQQKADTAALFTTINGLFDWARKCNRAERYQQKIKNRKIKFRNAHVEVLNLQYPNLMSGVRYFYQHKKWEEASQLASQVIECQRDTLFWQNDKPNISDTAVIYAAYLHHCAEYTQKNYAECLKYTYIASKDKELRSNIYWQTAQSYAALNDSASYIHYLQEGLKENPLEERFFVPLVEYMAQHEGNETTLKFIRQQREHAYSNIVFAEAELMCLYNLGRWDETLGKAKALPSDGDFTHYYIGASLCRKAEEIVLPARRNSREYRQLLKQRKDYYAEARGHMEKFRAMHPDAENMWASWLYDIYLNLNLGREFEEIQKHIE